MVLLWKRPNDSESSGRRYAEHVILHCKFATGAELATADDFLSDFYPDSRSQARLVVRIEVAKRGNPSCTGGDVRAPGLPTVDA